MKPATVTDVFYSTVSILCMTQAVSMEGGGIGRLLLFGVSGLALISLLARSNKP
jgi:hypothetical protein